MFLYKRNDFIYRARKHIHALVPGTIVWNKTRHSSASAVVVLGVFALREKYVIKAYRTLLELLSVRVPPSTVTVSTVSALVSACSPVTPHSMVSTPSRLISTSPVSGEGMSRYRSMSTHAALIVVDIHGQSREKEPLLLRTEGYAIVSSPNHAKIICHRSLQRYAPSNSAHTC